MKKKRVNLIRHRIIFFLLRPVFIIYMRLAYGYTFRKYKTEKNKGYLILANHNCNFDPFFIATSFNRPIYYVASDHIFRLGFISKVIEYLVAPIPILKSSIDLTAIKLIKRTIADGGVVCLFPSGNKSFNGISYEIQPSIAKLIKAINAPVLLYKLEGLYFSSPRWAKTRRVGKANGFVSKELSVEEIKASSLEQLYKVVDGTLYEDAYKVQRSKMIRYKGKRLTEGLERVLYMCPSCISIGKIKGSNNNFKCTCGYSVLYNEYGFFEDVKGSKLYFDNITEWDFWQKGVLQEKFLNSGFKDEEIIFTDTNMKLFQCKKTETQNLIAVGNLYGYKDKLKFINDEIEIEFKFVDILDLTCIASQILQFSLRNGITYEIRSKDVFSVTKYMHLKEAYINRGEKYEHSIK